MFRNALKTLSILTLFVIVVGCDQEDPVPVKAEANYEQLLAEKQPDGNQLYKNAHFRAECDLNGVPSSVAWNSTFNTTYSSNFTPNVYTWWTVPPGMLTKIGGSGANATFRVNGNHCIGSFTLYRRGAEGTYPDTGHACIDFRDVTVTQPCPTSLQINYICDDAVIASLSNTVGIVSVEWSVTSGGRGGTTTILSNSTNPNCVSLMQTPLYFPGSWWDGRTMTLTAKSTTASGSTCNRNTSITLGPC